MNAYEVIGKVSQGIPVGPVNMGDMMLMTMDKYREHDLEIDAELLVMDVNGGACMRCGKPYRRVDVKNKLIEFHYFEPSCNCYPRCVWCGRILHHETETNQAHCSNCPAPRCTEFSDKTEWNNETKKKETRRVRCPGNMRLAGKGWRCDVCGVVKGTEQIRRDMEKASKPKAY